MHSTRLIQLAAVALALGIVSTRVQADSRLLPPPGPLIKISELSTGSFADPNAQYLVLRMAAGTSDGKNLAGYTVVFYQVDFHETSRVTLATDANRGTRGAPYLIANAAAQTLYHVQPDLQYTGQPWATQGYICLYKPGSAIAPNSVQDPNVTKDDCLAYGNVQDTSTYLTDPTQPNLPLNPAGGVPRGFVARRVWTPGKNNSQHDFVIMDANNAWPANNRGVVGSPNSTVCGSGTLDGFKQCDAGSNNGILIPGCSATCLIVGSPNSPLCGNGVVDPGESCDDGSTADLDGCSSLCQWEAPFATTALPVCGNDLLEGNEGCDAASLPSSVCDANCVQIPPPTSPAPPLCGDGSLQPGEQCDDAQDPNCFADTCAWSGGHTYLCGNNIVEPGEHCDDGNTLNDGNGCTADCQLDFTAYYTCGKPPLAPGETADDQLPAVVEPGEQCDATDANCNPSTCTWTVAVVDPPSTTPPSTGNSTAGPGVNTTAGSGGANNNAGSSSTGGSVSSTGGTSTGGSGASTGTTGGADSGSSSSTTGGNTVIKSASCAQGGAPGLAWTLGAAALLWARRKRMACTLP